MRIPSTADPAVQQAFREVWASVDRVAGSANVNLAGRRLINAGQAVDPFDYTTKYEVDRAVEDLEARLSPDGETILEAPVFFEGFKPGSVLFVGIRSQVMEDNANFFWDNSNDRLGLGLNESLDSRLHLRGTTSDSARMRMDGYGAAPTIQARRTQGTVLLPTATLADTAILAIGGAGSIATTGFAGITERAAIYFRVAENWTSTAQGTYIQFYATKKTTTTAAVIVSIGGNNNMSVGGVLSDRIQFYQRGTFVAATGGASFAYALESTVEVTANQNGHGALIAPTLTRKTGTHPIFCGLTISGPALAGAAGTVTQVFGLGIFLNGVDYTAASPTETAALYINGPTAGGSGRGGESNYAIWSAAGLCRFDGATQTTIGTAGGASAPPASPDKYWVIEIEGVEYAIPCYDKA